MRLKCQNRVGAQWDGQLRASFNLFRRICVRLATRKRQPVTLVHNATIIMPTSRLGVRLAFSEWGLARQSIDRHTAASIYAPNLQVQIRSVFLFPIDSCLEVQHR